MVMNMRLRTLYHLTQIQGCGKMKSTITLGKKLVGRTETVADYVKIKNHEGAIIGISAFFGVKAYLMRLLRIRKRFIYYCIDYYVPWIAANIFDALFIWLHSKVDRFLALRADENWVISRQIDNMRGLYARFTVPTILVPLGYPTHYFRYRDDNNKHQLIYVGLNPLSMGLIQKILDAYPVLSLTTIGSKKLIPIYEMLEAVSMSGIGLALWGEIGNHTYGDPGKTKLYLICGLPVIITRNSNFADVIEKEQAGIAIDYTAEQLEEAIKAILSDYEFYRENAVRTARAYCNSEKIFTGLNLLEQ